MPCGRELAQLVADHLLGDEHRHVLAAVVDRDRVPDHFREDRRGPRPGADHVLLTGLVHRGDAAEQPLLDEGALLARSRHLAATFLPAAPWAHDQLVGFLVLGTGALAERRHAPGRDRVPAALRLALPAPPRLFAGVHPTPAHAPPLAPPPPPPPP